MIRTTARMSSTLDTDAATLRWAESGTVIPAGAARAIAAAWQSPGTAGHVLASLASGRAVELEELRDDIDRTRATETLSVIGARELDALEAWAGEQP